MWEDAIVTADSSEIVTFNISRHLADLGVLGLANAQSRVIEIGRWVVPSMRHQLPMRSFSYI